jgi:hypothetical protein
MKQLSDTIDETAEHRGWTMPELSLLKKLEQKGSRYG